LSGLTVRYEASTSPGAVVLQFVFHIKNLINTEAHYENLLNIFKTVRNEVKE